jgi:hypothetical protein
MSKRFTLLVIVALCSIAISSAYEPLSESEAREYVQRFPDAAAEDVMTLDVIEHEQPTVEIPTYNVIVVRDEVILQPREPLRFEVGHVGWKITLPEQRAAYEPARPHYVAVGAASFAAGALAALTVVVFLR